MDHYEVSLMPLIIYIKIYMKHVTYILMSSINHTSVFCPIGWREY